MLAVPCAERRLGRRSTGGSGQGHPGRAAGGGCLSVASAVVMSGSALASQREAARTVDATLLCQTVELGGEFQIKPMLTVGKRESEGALANGGADYMFQFGSRLAKPNQWVTDKSCASTTRSVSLGPSGLRVQKTQLGHCTDIVRGALRGRQAAFCRRYVHREKPGLAPRPDQLQRRGRSDEGQVCPRRAEWETDRGLRGDATARSRGVGFEGMHATDLATAARSAAAPTSPVSASPRDLPCKGLCGRQAS